MDRFTGLLGLVALPANGYDPTVTYNYPTLKGGRFGSTCRPTLQNY